MPRVVSGNGWIVNIDFAVLNDVGIHLTKQGQRIQHAAWVACGLTRASTVRARPCDDAGLGRDHAPMSY